MTNTNDWPTLDTPTLDGTTSSEATPDASFLGAQRQAGLTTPKPAQPPRPSPQMDRNFAGTFLLFLGGMAAMVVLALGPMSGIEAYQIHDRLVHWPHAEAVVDHCESYYKLPRPGGPTSNRILYGMRCYITFMVESRQSKGVADLGYLRNDREPMLEWAHRFHPGNRIEIAYHPTYFDSILFADPSLAYAGPLWKGRIAFWALLAAIVALPFGFSLRRT